MLATGPRAITATEFRGVCDLLGASTGIRLSPGKEALVMGRLDRRLRQLGLRTYTEYLGWIARPEHAEELRRAIDLLTTNETFFFREEAHFQFLIDVIIPAYRGDHQFRLWSAASSTGEEAYTAAMILAEALPLESWEILGTDVSSRVVHSAQRGVYPLAAAERIPTPLLQKYFLKGRDEYDGLMMVTRQLRSKVTFRCANLMGDLRQFGVFDVVFLRNVMIYFDSDTRAQVVAQVEQLLRPGGYLIVSHSETLMRVQTRLRVVRPSVYQLPGDSGARRP